MVIIVKKIRPISIFYIYYRSLMKRLSDLVLVWFQKNKRILPWREEPTPYSVWISEIMLQQTVVKVVIPYFQEWMKRFPDIKTLAKAKERTVLRFWEGLGYYSRAKNILKTARVIVRDHQGKFPEEYQALIKLPGIGDYTASAILSIAFSKPYPAIDANVKRVLRRILAWQKWDKKKENQLKDYLNKVIPSRCPGQFNEALMELGQTICLPDEPVCLNCPIKHICTGFQKNLQNLIPEKKVKVSVMKKTALLILVNKGRILLYKKEKGVLSKLWLLPGLVHSGSHVKLVAYIKKHFAGNCQFIQKLVPRVHTYTKYRDKLIPYIYIISNLIFRKTSVTQDYIWVPFNQLNNYPVPSIYRETLNEFLALDIFK